MHELHTAWFRDDRVHFGDAEHDWVAFPGEFIRSLEKCDDGTVHVKMSSGREAVFYAVTKMPDTGIRVFNYRWLDDSRRDIRDSLRALVQAVQVLAKDADTEEVERRASVHLDDAWAAIQRDDRRQGQSGSSPHGPSSHTSSS